MIAWTVSSSALILGIVLLRALTWGKISMRLRYALWGVVLLRALVPFSFGAAPVSIMNIVQQVPVVREAETLRDFWLLTRSPDGTVEGYLESDYMADFPTVVAHNKSEADFARMNTLLSARRVLAEVWKGGALLMMTALLLVNVRFRHALRRTRTRLEQTDVPLTVYVTDAVETPCLVGLFQPAIYVTPEVRDDPRTMHYALEHEMTHFYHGDFFWSALRCVCLVLHWFNPLVYLASALSRQDAELACDEGTIRRLGESHRISYGDTLIDLTCAGGASAVLYAATTMTGSRAAIRERITALAKRPRTLGTAALLLVLVLTVLAVGCTFTGADDRAEEEAVVPLTEEELPFSARTSFPRPAPR